MPRRRWVKVWTQETLYGTTSSELDPAERWIWIGFLLLAGDSPIPGTICAAPDVPFTDDQLAKILRVPMTHLVGAKAKMLEYGKIDLNGSGIQLHNWEHYDWIEDRKLEGRRRLSVAQRRRLQIIERDGLTCRLCGRPISDSSDVEIDHIVPQSHGGSSEPSNLQVAHARCNRLKGARYGP